VWSCDNLKNAIFGHLTNRIMWLLVLWQFEQCDMWSIRSEMYKKFLCVIWNSVTCVRVTFGIICHVVVWLLEKCIMLLCDICNNMICGRVTIRKMWYLIVWKLEYFDKWTSEIWNKFSCSLVPIGIMWNVFVWKVE